MSHFKLALGFGVLALLERSTGGADSVEEVETRRTETRGGTEPQVGSSLTRVMVSRSRHDDLVDALAGTFSKVKVGL
jgi:hypothetical protein